MRSRHGGTAEAGPIERPTLLLFNNGVILGALAADYAARSVTILLGWLMPPGSVEILATPLLVIMELAGLRSGGDSRECARAELHRQI